MVDRPQSRRERIVVQQGTVGEIDAVGAWHRQVDFRPEAELIRRCRRRWERDGQGSVLERSTRRLRLVQQRGDGGCGGSCRDTHADRRGHQRPGVATGRPAHEV